MHNIASTTKAWVAERMFGAKLIVGVAVIAVIALLMPRPVHDLLLYNSSPSIKVGFYLRTASVPARFDVVTVRASEVAPEEARLRHFTGAGDRFIKHVAAIGGDIVCADGAVIRINERPVAIRHAFGSTGRRLQQWQGCGVLAADELFLLGESPDSFDSRYWGPVRRSQIEGVWKRVL